MKRIEELQSSSGVVRLFDLLKEDYARIRAECPNMPEHELIFWCVAARLDDTLDDIEGLRLEVFG